MIAGKYAYFSGASGTIAVPTGATVKQIVVHSTAGGTIVIFGGASIPVIAGTAIALRMNHDACVSKQTPPSGGGDIVFTGTDSYYVETIGPGY